MPVRAAFRGLGIYRASTLRQAIDCRYGEEHKHCEDTPLHFCLGHMGHQAKLFIVPGLAVNWECCQLFKAPCETSTLTMKSSPD